MKALDLSILNGPNVYTYRQALVALVDLEEVAELTTCDIPGFNDALVAILPGLAKHTCGLGYEGGFLERLSEGTYFGHVSEHVALELQLLSGFFPKHAKTRATKQPGVYRVVMEIENEECGLLSFHGGLEIVSSLIEGKTVDLAAILQRIEEAKKRTDPGPSTLAIVEAARKRGIPVTPMDEDSCYQLGYGKHRKLVQATETSFTPSIGVDISCDKFRTKLMLERFLLPTPRGYVVRNVDDAMEHLARLGAPVVLKPLDGNHGRGVTIDICTREDLERAFVRASAEGSEFLLEEQFVGNDYRILIVGGKMVAAALRAPAHVVGDGSSTIGELIERENRTNPLRGEGHSNALSAITIDSELLEFLSKRGMTLDSVPQFGRSIAVRSTANISTGGTATDLTDEVHPSIQAVCERAARAIGLDVCGIDFMTLDITKPLPTSHAGILEVNAAPGIRMHHFPSQGKSRDAAGAIVEMMFPNGENGRVPIVSVTGTNGKTTVARMAAHLIGASGRTVGLTTTEGIWVGRECVALGDLTGAHSARSVLGDPLVDVAVLETARGGILKRGLGYDQSEVGIVTNIELDHIGQDGIETINDLVNIKALVAEQVRDGGTVVLNADNPHVVSLRADRRVRADRKRIVLFSLDPSNVLVQRHLLTGGTAYWTDHGWIMEGSGSRVTKLIQEESIPVAFGGLAQFQIANVIAAIAAARAVGVSAGQIRNALPTFGADETNSGRANLVAVGGGHLLIDYGHNPAAFASVAEFARRWSDRRITAVVSVPGDRSDDLIRMCGEVLGNRFDRVIVKEDSDKRGREVGEVARLLSEAISGAAPQAESEIVLDEADAIIHAVATMQQDELIVVFYEKLEVVKGALERISPAHVDTEIPPVELPPVELTTIEPVASEAIDRITGHSTQSRTDVRR